MSEKFEERFKGKTSKMDRTGLSGMIGKGQRVGGAERGGQQDFTEFQQDENESMPGKHNQRQSEGYGKNQYAKRSLSKGIAEGKDRVGKETSSMNRKGNPSATSSKSNVMGKAGEKLLRNEGTKNTNMKRDTSTQKMNSGLDGSDSGKKPGGQFQQNAVMMMDSPFQQVPFMGNYGPSMPMYPQMAMGAGGQQIAYVPMVMPVRGNPSFPYSMNYQYNMDRREMEDNYSGHMNIGVRTMPTNFTGGNGRDGNQRKYGLTEQGDFKKGLGEYVPTKSAGDGRRKFTPYTINDYKSLSKTHNTKLGGLGANHNSDWEQKAKKAEKLKEFSNMIRGLNNEKIAKQPIKPKVQEKETTPTLRDKAMAFSKTIPKPKPKKHPSIQNEDNTPATVEKEGILDEEILRVEDDLEALERQHQYYQQKINNLKS